MHYKTVIKKIRAITVSRNFNPIHNMQIEYFQKVKANGDKLFVLVPNFINNYKCIEFMLFHYHNHIRTKSLIIIKKLDCLAG